MVELTLDICERNFVGSWNDGLLIGSGALFDWGGKAFAG